MRTGRLVLAAAVALLLTAVPFAGAQQQGEAPKVTPEQQAAMETYMKLATPGAAHKALEPMIGTWNVTTTMWQKPGAAPQTGGGTAENSWVLGGRFIRQDFDGEFGGMKYQGLGFTGYDNYKKKYVGTWMDTMGTMMMHMLGTADPSGKVFTLGSTVDDAMTGKSIRVKTVTRIVGANKHVMEMYGPDPTGKEFKMMEIVYTRK